MKTAQTYMAWEIPYSDGSGVEKEVRYNGNASTPDMQAEIIFKGREGFTSFLIEDIDWLIACLQQIKEEQGV